MAVHQIGDDCFIALDKKIIPRTQTPRIFWCGREQRHKPIELLKCGRWESLTCPLLWPCLEEIKRLAHIAAHIINALHYVKIKNWGCIKVCPKTLHKMPGCFLERLRLCRRQDALRVFLQSNRYKPEILKDWLIHIVVTRGDLCVKNILQTPICSDCLLLSHSAKSYIELNRQFYMPQRQFYMPQRGFYENA